MTAATGGPSARDARRRKILERGTDRLAFITGQTRSVGPPVADITPPPPPPPTPLPDQKPLPSADPVTLSSDDASRILKSAIGSAAAKNASDTGNRVDSSSTGARHPQSGLPQTSAIPERTVLPSVSERSSSSLRADATQNNTAPRTFHQVFTPNRITHCVAASENIRLLCAVIIAILVASSYRGSNLFGMLASSLRYVGPLYVVLLTDIAIVTGMLLINEVPDKDDDGKRSGGHEFDLAKAIEIGLMVYRATKTVFMDCCVCAVIVIVALPYRPKV